jgi:hypothetical protein
LGEGRRTFPKSRDKKKEVNPEDGGIPLRTRLTTSEYNYQLCVASFLHFLALLAFSLGFFGWYIEFFSGTKIRSLGQNLCLDENEIISPTTKKKERSI